MGKVIFHRGLFVITGDCPLAPVIPVIVPASGPRAFLEGVPNPVAGPVQVPVSGPARVGTQPGKDRDYPIPPG